MLLKILGIIFVIAAILILLMKFAVVKSQAKAAVPTVDAYIFVPLILSSGIDMLVNMEDRSLSLFWTLFLTTLLLVGLVLHIGRRIGKSVDKLE